MQASAKSWKNEAPHARCAMYRLRYGTVRMSHTCNNEPLQQQRRSHYKVNKPSIIMNKDASSRLLQLPDTLLALILEYGTFSERKKVFNTCQALRRRFADIQALIFTAKVISTRELCLFQRCFAFSTTNLTELDLSSHCTDEFLHSLAYYGTINGMRIRPTSLLPPTALLPNLQSISMVNSQQVTDEGLESLSKGAARAQNLRSIDITYCHQTTYAGTFCLRDALSNLQLLRRIPDWMVGSFETPFENDGLHNYYADGTFCFERSVQSKGFVVQVQEWDTDDPDFCFDKLQYINFEKPPGWPEWMTFCYRPGVSLLRLPDNQVLAGQCVHGLRPSYFYPRRDHAQVVPEPQTTRFFDGNDVLLPQDSDEDERRRYLVSRMRVFPLPSLMPPKELVEQNRAFCKKIKEQWNGPPGSLADAEAFLHDALSRPTSNMV